MVDGKFRILEQLASGTDIVSFLAEHTGIRRQVELKSVPPGAPAKGPAADRLLREARAMGGVAHPNLQSVVDSGLDPDGRPYVVYEALRGTTVPELLAEHPDGIDVVRAARIVLAVLEALRALHRSGVVVRGLRPENVVLTARRQGDDAVKLRGLERAAFLAEGAPPSEVPYSPYLAPEIRRGDHGLDPRVDVYSAGMLLKHLLTGRTTATTTALPDTARRAIVRSTTEDPDERFPDVEIFMQAVSLLTPTDARPAREEMPTPEDPLVADLHYLSLRRSTRHGMRATTRGEAKVQLLTVLLAIEAIYKRLGPDGWARLAEEVPGVDDLLPGAGNTGELQRDGVPIELFARVLGAADTIGGNGDLGLLTEMGEAVAQRGLRRLFPDLPETSTAAALITGFPYLWSRITRQGIPLVIEHDDHSARLTVREQIEPTLELSGFFAGLLRAAIRAAGAPHADVYLTACQALGDAADVYGVALTAR